MFFYKAKPRSNSPIAETDHQFQTPQTLNALISHMAHSSDFSSKVQAMKAIKLIKNGVIPQRIISGQEEQNGQLDKQNYRNRVLRKQRENIIEEIMSTLNLNTSSQEPLLLIKNKIEQLSQGYYLHEDQILHLTAEKKQLKENLQTLETQRNHIERINSENEKRLQETERKLQQSQRKIERIVEQFNKEKRDILKNCSFGIEKIDIQLAQKMEELQFETGRILNANERKIKKLAECVQSLYEHIKDKQDITEKCWEHKCDQYELVIKDLRENIQQQQDKKIQKLENELKASTNELETANAQLEATKEQAKIAKRELQAFKQELKTSKWEIQALQKEIRVLKTQLSTLKVEAKELISAKIQLQQEKTRKQDQSAALREQIRVLREQMELQREESDLLKREKQMQDVKVQSLERRVKKFNNILQESKQELINFQQVSTRNELKLKKELAIEKRNSKMLLQQLQTRGSISPLQQNP